MYRYHGLLESDIWTDCDVILFAPDLIERLNNSFWRDVNPLALPPCCIVRLSDCHSYMEYFWGMSNYCKDEYTLTQIGTL